jgi:hypothetical protein
MSFSTSPRVKDIYIKLNKLAPSQATFRGFSSADLMAAG